ncbi:MAG: hypothetical protein IJS38_02680 [Erysipelotrichaceae bacterium]|nr:hypothetical protein [Erysipelotrichaceae bacterium]
MVLALFILSLITLLSSPLIRGLRNLLKADRVYYQDEIGIYQLQLELAVNDIVSVEADQIVYRKQGEDFCLHIVNGKLISQPGTVDFVHGIEEVEFADEDDIIYLRYRKDGIAFDWPVAYWHKE